MVNFGEKLASFFIIIGVILWVISIFFLGGRWQPQVLSAAILVVAIFIAHIWEELFQQKK
ncbi:MAG: hypothetical protein OXP71_11085 [Candidatus Poribacteria bacterium]|nr:hypothetical protein [Candidatus Poribacteria bacterium]